MGLLNRLLRQLRSNEGVTLIELLAVVVILAIIAVVAIPVVMNQINNAKVKTDKQNEAIIVTAMQQMLVTDSKYTVNGLTAGSLDPTNNTGAAMISVTGPLYNGPVNLADVMDGQYAVYDSNDTPPLESIPTPRSKNDPYFQISTVQPTDTQNYTQFILNGTPYYVYP